MRKVFFATLRFKMNVFFSMTSMVLEAKSAQRIFQVIPKEEDRVGEVSELHAL